MPEKVNELLSEPLVVVNIGLKGFADSMTEQGVEVVQVDWEPPAGGDTELMDILDKLL